MSAPSIRSKWTGDDTMGLIAEYDEAIRQLEQVTAERDQLRDALQALVTDYGLDETVMDGNWERARAAIALAGGGK